MWVHVSPFCIPLSSPVTAVETRLLNVRELIAGNVGDGNDTLNLFAFTFTATMAVNQLECQTKNANELLAGPPHSTSKIFEGNILVYQYELALVDGSVQQRFATTNDGDDDVHGLDRINYCKCAQSFSTDQAGA